MLVRLKDRPDSEQPPNCMMTAVRRDDGTVAVEIWDVTSNYHLLQPTVEELQALEHNVNSLNARTPAKLTKSMYTEYVSHLQDKLKYHKKFKNKRYVYTETEFLSKFTTVTKEL